MPENQSPIQPNSLEPNLESRINDGLKEEKSLTNKQTPKSEPQTTLDNTLTGSPTLRPPQPQPQSKLSKQEQLKQQQKPQPTPAPAPPSPGQRLQNEKSIINTLSTLFLVEMGNKNKSIPTWQKSMEAAVERIALQLRTNPSKSFMQLRKAFFMNYRGNPAKINQAFNQCLNRLVQAYKETQKEVQTLQKRGATQLDPNNPDSTRNALQTTGAEQFNFIFRQKVAALEMALLAEANELAMANQAIDQKEEEDQAEDNINSDNLEHALEIETTPTPEPTPSESVANKVEQGYTAKLLEPRPEPESKQLFEEAMKSNAEEQESMISKFFSGLEKAATLAEEATAAAGLSFER